MALKTSERKAKIFKIKIAISYFLIHFETLNFSILKKCNLKKMYMFFIWNLKFLPKINWNLI